MAAQPPQPNMEDILSSIRSTMEEEAARTGPSADEGDDGDVLVLENELSDEEILALADTDVLDGDVTTHAQADEGLIDLAAFTSSGTVQVGGADSLAADDDVLGMNLPAGDAQADVTQADQLDSTVMSAADEMTALDSGPETAETAEPEDAFDRLMSDLKQDKEASHAQRVKDLLADEHPLDEEGQAAGEAEILATAVPLATSLTETTQAPARRVELPALTGPAGGLQVALPAEVLAEALRPLISQWLSENLPGVVERLVQQEIKKLTQQ